MVAKDEVFYNWQSACEFIYNKLKKAIPISGKGITVEQTPKGARINLRNGSRSNGTFSNGTGSYPCKVTGGSNSKGYTVSIYADGKHEASTGSGTLEVLELLWGDDVPTGTWLICHDSSITVTGGSDE